jgi:hypothetical protein
MVSVVAPPTEPVAMGKVALVAPAGTVTLAGTAAAALLLDRAMVTPAAGAGPLSVTVPVAGSPSTTAVGLRVKAEKATEVTVSVPVLVTVPDVAEMVTAVVAATGEVVTAKVAVMAPAAMVTEAGTVTEGSPLDSATVKALVTEALRLSVPVDPAPPTTEAGLKLTESARTRR